MADIKLTFDSNPEAFEQMVKLGQDAMAYAIKLTATDVWGNIRKNAPVDQGRLAGSFQMSQEDTFSWRIFSNVHYALDVHEGTGIYGPTGQPIVPTSGKALKFFWKKLGQTVIFKGDLPNSFERARFAQWAEERGMKPFFSWPKGMPPRPYATQSIEQSSGRTQEFIGIAMKEVYGEVSG